MPEREPHPSWPKRSRIPPLIGILVGLGEFALGVYLWVLSYPADFPLDVALFVAGFALFPVGAIQLGRSVQQRQRDAEFR